MSGLELNGATFWGGRPVARQISDARPQARVAVTGIITATQTVTIGSSPACRCTLTDRTGEIYMLFLGRTEVSGLTAGRHCSVTGTAGTSGRRLVVWNPRYSLQPPGETRKICPQERWVPVRAGETARLASPVTQ
jgi:RecG-like helicase